MEQGPGPLVEETPVRKHSRNPSGDLWAVGASEEVVILVVGARAGHHSTGTVSTAARASSGHLIQRRCAVDIHASISRTSPRSGGGHLAQHRCAEDIQAFVDWTFSGGSGGYVRQPEVVRKVEDGNRAVWPTGVLHRQRAQLRVGRTHYCAAVVAAGDGGDFFPRALHVHERLHVKTAKLQTTQVVDARLDLEQIGVGLGGVSDTVQG